MKNKPTKVFEHYYQCGTCQEWVDMRKLSEVFEHEHAGVEIKGKYNSKRVGDTKEYLNGEEEVNLN